MDTMASNVVVVGSFNIDHVWQCESLPRAGETLKGQYRTGPGGKGFNQATAAARAGAHTVATRGWTRWPRAMPLNCASCMARPRPAPPGFIWIATGATAS